MKLKIKYDLRLMKFISFFESMTNAKVKDCIEVESFLIFIVEPLQIGKAIGKKGSNVRKIEHLLKKKIKIVEFDNDKIKFLKNLLYPITNFEVIIGPGSEEDKKIKIKAKDLKTRGIIIGRNASHLRQLEDILRRYFEVEEIMVV